MFQTDFLCCGIAPLGEQLVAFAYVEEEETQDDEDEEDETTSEEGSNDGSFRGGIYIFMEIFLFTLL